MGARRRQPPAQRLLGARARVRPCSTVSSSCTSTLETVRIGHRRGHPERAVAPYLPQPRDLRLPDAALTKVRWSGFHQLRPWLGAVARRTYRRVTA